MTDLQAPVGVQNLYATPTDLKRRIGIGDTSHDMTVWHLLNVASRVVEGYCGRNFYVSLASKRFDVDSRKRMVAKVDDVIELSQVLEDCDGDGVYDLVREVADLMLYPLNIDPKSHDGMPYHTLRLVRKPDQTYFTSGRSVLQVTGIWGYRMHTVSLDGYIDNGGSSLTEASRSIRVDDSRHMRAGQTIWIDDEQMFVRQVGASVLNVERGINGTQASEHEDGSLISVLQFPAEVVEATLLTAVDRWRRRDGVARSDDVAENVSRSLYNPTEDVKNLLSPYRRRLVKV